MRDLPRQQVAVCPAYRLLFVRIIMQPNRAPASSGFRVLVVDDEKNIRHTLAVCLEGLGCTVTAVASEEEALSALRGQAFDLAFLDLRLGKTSGLDLLPHLL